MTTLSPAMLTALHALADGREVERTAPHYGLVRRGFAVVTEVSGTLDHDLSGRSMAKVKITAAGRARLAAAV